MKRILFLLVLVALYSCKKVQPQPTIDIPTNIKLSGPVFGTTYNVVYESDIDYSKAFDSLFTMVNNSMSTYIPDSDISRLNRNEDVKVDDHFERVFQKSREIFDATEGAFDPTIGNVVNAWNFGADENKFLTDSTTIDSLMRFVGFDRVTLSNRTLTKDPGTYIEFNAIAKGYGVDVIAEFLESKAVSDYLVEIGGEIRSKGINKEKDASWRVGLDEPRFDGGQSVYKAITLGDVGMATSGTYRKFKIDEDGNRYTHIINTTTGYPSKTNILSVSVIAEDCMTADAYATAFQAMGLERVKSFLKDQPDIKVFLIFENDNQELDTMNLNGFPES